MTRHDAAIARDDDGFGLIEIVVSMLVLAALALAFLPLLVQGLQLSARNATLAAATQQVNDRLQAAQERSPDCDAIVDDIEGTRTYTDARDVELRIVTDVENCPAANVTTTVKVTATATRLDTGEELATATTRVLVTG